MLMDVAVLKLLADLPLVLSLMVIAFFLSRELLRYLKNRDIINGKIDEARIAFEKETEVTQGRTNNELFALFREINKFNLDNFIRDEEYRKSALKAQYDTTDAIKDTKHSIDTLIENMTLPETRIVEAINIRLEAIKNGFLAYHDQNKEEILEAIKKMFENKVDK